MHHTPFAAMYKNDILLFDRNYPFPGRSNGGSQGNGQIFTDHIQYVEIGTSGRRLQIKTCPSAKLKNFESIVDDRTWRGTLLQDNAICELLQFLSTLASVADGLRFR
jgi:hypothetical protein